MFADVLQHPFINQDNAKHKEHLAKHGGPQNAAEEREGALFAQIFSRLPTV